MNGSRRRPEKKPGLKPSLTCAICKRRYQLLQTPGVQTIYSICPDCRTDAPPRAKKC